jgi:type IV pilus biogenesis protein CpaD/CtpE
VITADASTAHRIQAAIIATGVRPADVGIVASAQPVGVERRDLVASVDGCYGGPRSVVGLWTLDDGFNHDNANSALLGCAVRRNIAAMTDDPRTLMAAEPASPRDGARGAAVYGNWSRGEATASKAQLPSALTQSSGSAAGAQ